MNVKRRVFISSPRNKYLDKRQNEIKTAIIQEIEVNGYEVQIFGSEDGGKGLAGLKSWSPEEVKNVMQQCVGAVVLGFPLWTFTGGGYNIGLVSEYCQYEGAVARTYDLPILSLLQEGVEERVFFNRYGNTPVVFIPKEATATWVKEKVFQNFFANWLAKIQNRRDVFLGYATGSKAIADKIRESLETELQVTVLDWHEFMPANTILVRLEEAAARCTAAIFLFTNDDTFINDNKSNNTNSNVTSAPRDNVVYETGYFAHAKGKNRVLIIREKDSKMPVDLGGDIYALLEDRNDLALVKSQIKMFAENCL